MSELAPGNTPLTEEEKRGLLLPVQTRDDLNRAEQDNILLAQRWVIGSRRRPRAVTRETWLVSLHKRMYEEVWAWAGRYRDTEKNIGVLPWEVRVYMRDLEADADAWLANTSPTRYGNDELAIRFGYRLVCIHPFPNGNGRWSRLASDALILALGGYPFTWGGASLLTEHDALRGDYIAALQTADFDGDLRPLMTFARRA
jgi:Fic-DOC domain mobile mystery protein B